MSKILAIVLFAFAVTANAKENITVLYAFSASDTTANYSRVMLEEANRIQNKYNFIFDAKPGAGGTLAALAVSNTPNTILHHSTAFFVRPNFFPKESWDLAQYREEFVLCRAPMSISSSKYSKWSEIGNKPVTVGISGLGVTTHIVAVKLQERFPNMVIVPFKSTTDAVLSMVTGNTDLAIGFSGELTQWINAGKVHVLGITGTRSHPGFPSLTGQGFDPIFGQMLVGQHYVVPASWSEDKSRELYDIFAQAAKSKTVTDSFRDDFCAPEPTTYKDLSKFSEKLIESEIPSPKFLIVFNPKRI